MAVPLQSWLSVSLPCHPRGPGVSVAEGLTLLAEGADKEKLQMVRAMKPLH